MLVGLLAAVFIGFTVEAIAGFGSTVVTLALASHLLPVEDILLQFIPVNLLLSLWLVSRSLVHVDLPWLTRRVLPWMLPGMLAGLFAARWGGPTWVRAAFASFIVVLSGIELYQLRMAVAVKPLTRPTSNAALTAAGVIHGLFACGGPLLVYAAGRELSDKSVFRATLSAVWLLLNAVWLTTFAFTGRLTADSLTGSAMMLIPLFAGGVLGNWAHAHVSASGFRWGVYSLLFLAGIALLLR